MNHPTPDAAVPAVVSAVLPGERLETQRKLLNRLRRASGQLTAVIAAVESGAPCRDVVTQLSAVSSALDRAGFQIISTAMRDCLADPEPGPELEPTGVEEHERLSVAEIEKLFMMLA